MVLLEYDVETLMLKKKKLGRQTHQSLSLTSKLPVLQEVAAQLEELSSPVPLLYLFSLVKKYAKKKKKKKNYRSSSSLRVVGLHDLLLVFLLLVFLLLVFLLLVFLLLVFLLVVRPNVVSQQASVAIVESAPERVLYYSVSCCSDTSRA